MNIVKISAYISTLGPIGYLMAPGTIATCITIPIAFWLQNHIQNSFYYGLLLLFLIVAGCFITNKAREHFGQHHDPSEIVIDEFVGCLISFWALPFSPKIAIFGFLLFRFFDISKIGGIRLVEKLNNGCGIMLDDVLAALITNIILRFLFLS